MGTTYWSYFVPYQNDKEKALQKLRLKIFEEGKYYKLNKIEDIDSDLLKPYFNMLKSRHSKKQILDIKENLRKITKKEMKRRKKMLEPKSIKELLKINAESGTHSIIDIEHISNKPGFGVASPFSKKELIEIFNTAKPSREIVKEKDDLGELDIRRTWHGTYIVVFKNSLPDELFFCGSSGD